jgi:hypothetical protein
MYAEIHSRIAEAAYLAQGLLKLRQHAPLVGLAGSKGQGACRAFRPCSCLASAPHSLAQQARRALASRKSAASEHHAKVVQACLMPAGATHSCAG